jgi:hypothetical protein
MASVIIQYLRYWFPVESDDPFAPERSTGDRMTPEEFTDYAKQHYRNSGLPLPFTSRFQLLFGALRTTNSELLVFWWLDRFHPFYVFISSDLFPCSSIAESSVGSVYIFHETEEFIKRLDQFAQFIDDETIVEKEKESAESEQ